METKQHATKQQMDQRGNQAINQKPYWNKWKWKHNFSKFMGCSKSSSKMEVHSYTGLPQEKRKIRNNNTKELGKEEQTKPKVNRRK